MFKVTPNPPGTDPSNSKAFDKAADRILDHYLKPKPKPSKSEADPGQLFTVANGVDTETLLANLSEIWPRPMPWSVTWPSTWKVPGATSPWASSN
jgi:hypothetical protein